MNMPAKLQPAAVPAVIRNTVCPAPEAAWQQVLARDPAADGAFFYAVRTTGIFCRPTCPSRRPLRRNVEFFATAADALAQGFRPCQRCKPTQTAIDAPAAGAAIHNAALFLQKRAGQPATLAQVAAASGTGRYKLLRGFDRVLGVSPAEIAREQRMQAFRDKLREPGVTVTDAIYEAGFGSSSRLYSNAAAELGMTPTDWKRGGEGVSIRYTVAASPLGPMLVAATARGICSIAFADGEDILVRELHAAFPRASITRLDSELAAEVAALLPALGENPAAVDLPLDIRATAFQRRVWRELQRIPLGETRSYSEVATALGTPRSVRAVARACASNPAAVVVPCHRVVGKSGSLTGYRWGVERKHALLTREGARTL